MGLASSGRSRLPRSQIINCHADAGAQRLADADSPWIIRIRFFEQHLRKENKAEQHGAAELQIYKVLACDWLYDVPF